MLIEFQMRFQPRSESQRVSFPLRILTTAVTLIPRCLILPSSWWLPRRLRRQLRLPALRGPTHGSPDEGPWWAELRPRLRPPSTPSRGVWCPRRLSCRHGLRPGARQDERRQSLQRLLSLWQRGASEWPAGVLCNLQLVDELQCI